MTRTIHAVRIMLGGTTRFPSYVHIYVGGSVRQNYTTGTSTGTTHGKSRTV